MDTHKKKEDKMEREREKKTRKEKPKKRNRTIMGNKHHHIISTIE